ncbi:hypothetical protein RFI_05468 [Reticulomyxa filosa]|uniref:Kelch motif family protein n=1 Tax=Reticulomyxa filosa TaxID=46433 RepID=X6P268_RETFI|nr:hypothetical protein RFI_05468 [Reticulomyxa filosa]|eukprot:ETO31652.1 hypothetical protein RFI_05468 [Reticulomyxa filosa]
MNPNGIRTKNNANMNTSSPFETVTSLPIPLQHTQCVVHNNEIIICGGAKERACYSYHALKQQYKFVCAYPKYAELYGHCVVKRVKKENPNDITLFSFGGQVKKQKHTLIMKYVSVWDYKDKNGSGPIIPNKWIFFTDKNNKPMCIGRYEDNYAGVRAVIGGRNNHLLFITYPPKHIDVFNLDTFQYVTNATLPTDIPNKIKYHCFVANTKKSQSEMKIDAMLLFCKNTGLSIEYDEEKNAFEFHRLRVCTTIRQCVSYGYACVKNCIFFFGGEYSDEGNNSREVHRYSITENAWMKFEQNLPISLSGCVGILTESKKCVHIIGGYDGDKEVPTHMKTRVKKWMKGAREIEKQWIIEEEEKRYIEEMYKDIEEMKDSLDIQKLKKKKKGKKIQKKKKKKKRMLM